MPETGIFVSFDQIRQIEIKVETRPAAAGYNVEKRVHMLDRLPIMVEERGISVYRSGRGTGAIVNGVCRG